MIEKEPPACICRPPYFYITRSSGGDTEAFQWFISLTLLTLFISMMTLVHLDFLLLDEARCAFFILISLSCWHASEFETRNPQLGHFTVHVAPHPSVQRAPLHTSMTRHMRQYHLWKRICCRLTARPVIPFGVDWDPSEYISHFK